MTVVRVAAVSVFLCQEPNAKLNLLVNYLSNVVIALPSITR